MLACSLCSCSKHHMYGAILSIYFPCLGLFSSLGLQHYIFQLSLAFSLCIQGALICLVLHVWRVHFSLTDSFTLGVELWLASSLIRASATQHHVGLLLGISRNFLSHIMSMAFILILRLGIPNPPFSLISVV